MVCSRTYSLDNPPPPGWNTSHKKSEVLVLTPQKCGTSKDPDTYMSSLEMRFERPLKNSSAPLGWGGMGIKWNDIQTRKICFHVRQIYLGENSLLLSALQCIAKTKQACFPVRKCKQSLPMIVGIIYILSPFWQNPHAAMIFFNSCLWVKISSISFTLGQ